jgi:hypothetical protein
MPRYLFQLSDGQDSFIDDQGKELPDIHAAHEHALRIIEKVHRFIPDATTATWKIRITLGSGQSPMTVVAPAIAEQKDG